MVNDAETQLKSSKKQVHFFEDKASVQSKQLVCMDLSSSDYLEGVIVLEEDLANASIEVEHLTTQRTVDKDLLNDIRTAFALHMKALQQPAAADAKDRKSYWLMSRLLTLNYVSFRGCMQAKTDSVQAF